MASSAARVVRRGCAAAFEVCQRLARERAGRVVVAQFAAVADEPDPVEPQNVRALVAKHPLVTAFVISLILHALIFGCWRMGNQYHWWENQNNWLLRLTRKQPAPVTRLTGLEKLMTNPEREVPMTFVEVDPALASEPPKDTKYYSQQNAKAANPDLTVEREKPKLEGKQEKIVRTADVPKPNPQPLQPALPPLPKPEPQIEPEIEPKPKGGETPGDLVLVKPSDIKKPDEGRIETSVGEAPHERPRRLSEVRQAKNMLAGEQMKQDGGVRRRGQVSLDVKATPFGAYDAAFIAAVQQRWYDLLDSTHFTQRTGKVVLEFRLSYDGRITDMKVNDNDVGEMLSLLCERAIMDPAPYPRWPSDMWRAVGKNYREVLFTFYYN